jgi:hypothetical protein
MFELNLLILAGIFTIGFGAGYGVREWKSRRRRRRSRPFAGYADHSRFESEKRAGSSASPFLITQEGRC